MQPTDRTRFRRNAKRGTHDRAVIDAILDEALVCHVAFTHHGAPAVIPTAFVRAGDALYLHGAAANGMLTALATGIDCAVAVTLLDALVFARTAFHHSVNYRSVVLFARGRAIDDLDHKRAVLDALVDRFAPARSTACRPPDTGELRATLVVELPITEAAAKVRTGPPIDDAADLALPFWAGIVPLVTTRGAPITAPDCAVAH